TARAGERCRARSTPAEARCGSRRSRRCRKAAAAVPAARRRLRAGAGGGSGPTQQQARPARTRPSSSPAALASPRGEPYSCPLHRAALGTGVSGVREAPELPLRGLEAPRLVTNSHDGRAAHAGDVPAAQRRIAVEDDGARRSLELVVADREPRVPAGHEVQLLV